MNAKEWASNLPMCGSYCFSLNLHHKNGSLSHSYANESMIMAYHRWEVMDSKITGMEFDDTDGISVKVEVNLRGS